MKVNFCAVVVDYRGEPIQTKDSEKSEPREMLMKDAACQALVAHLPGEDATPQLQLRKFQLSKTIWKSGGVINISTEDVALIKNVVSKAFAPAVAGSFCDQIENGCEQEGPSDA
jgi:hypothetical protein